MRPWASIAPILYTDTLDNPVNKRFVAEFRDRFKEYPNLYSEYGYTAAQLLDEAGKTIDGDVGNKDKLAEAMKKAAFDAPRGPFRMDPVAHTPIQNVYISEVKKVEGDRLANVADLHLQGRARPGREDDLILARAGAVLEDDVDDVLHLRVVGPRSFIDAVAGVVAENS